MNTVNFLNVEYIYLRIYDFFKNFDIVAILNWLIYWLDLIRPLAFVIMLVTFYVIIYAHFRTHHLEKENDKRYHASLAPEATGEHKHDEVLHQKWKQVEAHINSTNPSDWRLAILEADIMLDNILDKMGYQGDTMAEKFRGVDKSDFLTIDLAQEAHGVRNRIAHSGSDFLLSERDARKTIDMYKRVFEEFYYI